MRGSFVRHGLFGIAVATALASFTGRAEAAFLPGIIQSGVWALLMGTSMVVRWPLAGLLVGAVLDDLTGCIIPVTWQHPAAPQGRGHPIKAGLSTSRS